jgi:hypothetical protein
MRSVFEVMLSGGIRSDYMVWPSGYVAPIRVEPLPVGPSASGTPSIGDALAGAKE